ncbi:unnamed protein product [Phytophthora lilii]|uniref:Unnamed protein product n=1 Tax=Phytophthora lilii TaxID=2077276 RepID=A0A9W6WEY6_9STRA|nr:unnamed protein product [Phytophthora lilii]
MGRLAHILIGSLAEDYLPDTKTAIKYADVAVESSARFLARRRHLPQKLHPYRRNGDHLLPLQHQTITITKLVQHQHYITSPYHTTSLRCSIFWFRMCTFDTASCISCHHQRKRELQSPHVSIAAHAPLGFRPPDAASPSGTTPTTPAAHNHHEHSTSSPHPPPVPHTRSGPPRESLPGAWSIAKFKGSSDVRHTNPSSCRRRYTILHKSISDWGDSYVKMTEAKSLLLTLLLLAASAASLDAVQFDVRRRAEKCLSDEVAQGSLVVVHYNVIGGTRGQSGVALSITDPLRKFLKQDANIDTSSDDIYKFSFTADAGGIYAVCFVNSNDKPVRVMLDFKHGVEAKDYTEVAKREHLMPVEKELRKMEDTVDEIHREMLYMREREATMRNTNESTNSRVLWFSFFSIVVLLGMGVWQVMYLKKFFKSKKLI